MWSFGHGLFWAHGAASHHALQELGNTRRHVVGCEVRGHYEGGGSMQGRYVSHAPASKIHESFEIFIDLKPVGARPLVVTMATEKEKQRTKKTRKKKQH